MRKFNYGIILMVLSMFFFSCDKEEAIIIDETEGLLLKQSTKSGIAESNVKVITYNTHLYLSAALFRDADRQKELIKYVNNHWNADVIVLTEVWNDESKNEIANATKSNFPYDVHTDTGPLNLGDGIVVLSKFPINKQKFEVFNDAVGWDYFSYKGFWELELETREGTALYLYATHLQADDFNSSTRTLQINQIYKSMQDKLNYPMLLVGDLNIPSGTSEHQNFLYKLPFLSDPVPWKSTDFDTYNYHNRLAYHFSSSDKTISRYDYINYSKRDFTPVAGSLKMERPKYSTSIAGENVMLDVSDHYPLEVTYKLRTSKTPELSGVYSSMSEANAALSKMKNDYGNGVSALTSIQNNTNTNLYLNTYKSYNEGVFYTKPSPRIPPGKIGVFLSVHPAGEALGVESMAEYNIGDSGNFFTCTSIVPWSAFYTNQVDGRINSRVRCHGQGKSFTEENQFYRLNGSMGDGTSPRVSFTIGSK